MAEVSIEQLNPYLNPDYWDGHSLGRGEVVGVLPKTPASVRTPRPIRHTFEERIGSMQRIVPIETLGSGETFDAIDYNKGTVVMFREEELRGDASQLDIDVEDLQGRQVHPRPTEFALALGRQASPSNFLRSNNINYANRVYCGMVGEGKGDENIIYAASAFMIKQLGGGEVSTVGAVWSAYDTPIKVGDTVHARTKNSELLHRVNLLEVVAYGETERKRERAKGLLGRLSYRHQGA